MKSLLILALCSIASACGGADARPRFFNRSDWQSPVACTRLRELGGLSAVADLNIVSDSTFVVLLGDERKLLRFDAALRQVDSVVFDKDGPRGVLRPVSIVMTDSMLFLSDDARSSIRFFRPGGTDAGTLRLSFIPRRVRMTAGRLIVTPLVAGGSPAELVFEVRDRRVVALGGPIARYDDVGVNTLANMTSVAAFADRVLVMHEMVVPFGYVIRPSEPASLVRRFSVPVSADLRDRLGRSLSEPLSDRNVGKLAVVAFSAASVPATGSVLYVTRTGDDGRNRKILVRLDSLLNVETVAPIDVSPHHMIYFPARNSLIVVDADSEWFECKLS
jgi:hypothetical protein